MMGGVNGVWAGFETGAWCRACGRGLRFVGVSIEQWAWLRAGSPPMGRVLSTMGGVNGEWAGLVLEWAGLKACSVCQ